MRTPPRSTYVCEGGFAFRVQIDGPTVRVSSPGLAADLQRVEAASGAKYEGDGVTFWSKTHPAATR